MLQVIPVIDLLHGQVVHAKRGDRANYLPVRSALCEGSDPLTVTGALLELHPFKTMYVADLGAIQGLGGHRPALHAIRARFPGLELWVDAGLSSARELLQWSDEGLGTPILGAESIASDAELSEISARLRRDSWILSMDFRGDAFMGPPGLMEQPALWPTKVLAMNLARVGSGSGPDVELIGRLRRLAPGSAVYAAGGVRGPEDLGLAEQAGAAGALVATALHDGRLGRAALSGTPKP
ncbi:MAG: HisA/HisF-related TIM barrel protein [Burkholderiales bacterium]